VSDASDNLAHDECPTHDLCVVVLPVTCVEWAKPTFTNKMTPSDGFDRLMVQYDHRNQLNLCGVGELLP
jgi:hypothetical protein